MNTIKTLLVAALFITAGAVNAQEVQQETPTPTVGEKMVAAAQTAAATVKAKACEAAPEMKVRGSIHGAAASALHTVADWTPNLFGAKDAIRSEARQQNIKEYTNKAGGAITGTICEL